VTLGRRQGVLRQRGRPQPTGRGRQLESILLIHFSQKKTFIRINFIRGHFKFITILF
jgi:hypothetical protein